MSNDDDLFGFKDFISRDKSANSQKMYKDSSSSFELFTFLEQESDRLEKRILLFEEKSYLFKNYPQDTSLISRQDKSNQKLKSQLCAKLQERGSPLFESLQEVFENHFN